jgi:vacuolar-type H+-ATPase subunit E/Vma4
MPLDHLLGALERDGSAQAEDLLVQARATVAAIAREADELVARRRADVLGGRETELRGAAQAALGETRRTGRRAVLTARQRLLERVFGAARGLFFEALASEAYRARALPEHLAEALGAVGDEPAVIRCPETLVPAVRAAVARKKHLTVQGDPAAPPGIRVVTTDGAIEVDNTLEGRLDRLRARLALEVLAKLGTSP